MNKLAIACIPTLLLGATLLSACDPAASMDQEKKNDTPAVVKQGAAFTHDSFKAGAGWKVVNERFAGPTIKGLEVTNKGGDQRIAQLTFRFYQGKRVLAEVECSSNEMQKGETSPLDCFSTASKFPKGFDAIKVADMW